MKETTPIPNGAYRPAWTALAMGVLVGALLGHTSLTLAAAAPGPAVIDAGPVAITPTLGMEAKYRDNIYLQETNETDSWIYLLKPAITARMQDRENSYQLGYEGEASWYTEENRDDENGYFDNTFTGDAHMLLSARWTADAYVSWADLHEDRGTGLSEGAIGQVLPEPIQFEQTDVGGSLQYGSGGDAGRLQFDAGYMEKSYQNFRELTRSRDRDETTVGATFFYPVAPKTDVLIEYTYSDIAYPNPFEQVALLDSQENSLQLGVEWEITPNMTSRAQAGYVDKSFDDSDRADWNGLGWSLELRMQPRDQDTITVTGRRAPEETTLQGDFILRETLAADWSHDWADRFYTNLSGSVGRDRYRESLNDRDDYIYNVSLRAGYQFRRWANLYASYSWDEKDSNVDRLSYTDNTFLIGVDLSL